MKVPQCLALLLLFTMIVLSGCFGAPADVRKATKELILTSTTEIEPTLSDAVTLDPTLTTTVLPAATAIQPVVQTTLPIPFNVSVSADAWIIDHPAGRIQIQFDNSVWESTQFDEMIPLYYEGGPVLTHNIIEGCNLSLNFGGGVPMNWVLDTNEISLGDHPFSKKSFHNGEGELQFVIYDQLFRITFEGDVGRCLQQAEIVLGSYQVSQ
ncbi:MAG: hypothetical protein ISR58_10715 [Anaerolineales bacterium]|nr:hypothetical protein [Chloroflexota bacterium]MBL6981647.1 hypothetical protein [Anaerolineales bacterium]